MSNAWMTNALLAAGKENQDDIGFSFPNPIKAIGKVGKAIGGTIRAGHKGISKTLASVPVVGPGLDAAYKITPLVAPITISANVAAGKRIDRAAYEGFKEQVKAYQDIAPYVQTVVSGVPGIGQGLSGAIGAANALSKGRPITDAMLEAAKGAMPGGPLGQAAFSVAVTAIQGKPVTEVMLNAIPMDPAQKRLLVAGVMAAKDIASGKPADEAMYNNALKMLPPDGQKALQVGIALAQGQKLQHIVANAVPSATPNFFKIGEMRLDKNPVLKAGAQVLSTNPDVKKGFVVGAGFMTHKITPAAMLALRRSLPADGKKGFDIAVSTQIGEVAKPVAKDVPPKLRFGYYATQGMQGGKPGRKTEMMRTLVKDPDVRKGASKAVKEIQGKNQTGFWAFWGRFIKRIGL
jgi:hypothetical protein